MRDYPQDIISLAGEVCRRLDIKSTVTNCLPIMDAVLAERERCAQIAEEYHGDIIADAIRTPSTLKANDS